MNKWKNKLDHKSSTSSLASSASFSIKSKPKKKKKESKVQPPQDNNLIYSLSEKINKEAQLSESPEETNSPKTPIINFNKQIDYPAEEEKVKSTPKKKCFKLKFIP